MSKILLIVATFMATAALGQRSVVKFSSITGTQAIGNKIFCSAAHETMGTELFVSDGKRSGPTLLKDINPGWASSSPQQFTVYNNQLFFIAFSPAHGFGIWKSDGTPEGTTLVYGVLNAETSDLIVFKNKLYFTTNTGALMRTDGTTEGTEVIYQADYTWSRIMTVVKTNDYLYFSEDGRTVHRFNGTSTISFLGALSWEDVYFRKLAVVGNNLVIIKSSSYNTLIRIYSIGENEIYNGFKDEWPVIKKIDSPSHESREFGDITIAGGKLFFSLRTEFSTNPTDDLWVSDGTSEGTKTIMTSPWQRHFYASGMSHFFSFNNRLFFRSGAGESNSLWASDGTSEGTVKIHDVSIYPHNDDPFPVLTTENRFYFSGETSSGNAELWESDGSTGGTQLMFDIEDEGGSLPHHLAYAEGIVYFVTTKPSGATLWSTLPAPDIAVEYERGVIPSGSVAYNFAYADPGSCSTQKFRIINKGLADLYLSSIFINSNDFYLINSPIKEKLLPGESAEFHIVYYAVSNQASVGKLTILSNDLDEPQYIVNLRASPFPYMSGEPCLSVEDNYVKKLSLVSHESVITLSNSTIHEGSPVGAFVGTLTMSGQPDAIISFAEGAGDADNHLFIISNNELKTNSVFRSSVRSVYSIKVQAAWEGGTTANSLSVSLINESFGFEEASCGQAFERMDFTYRSIERNSAGHLFTATSNGKILRSTDEGQSWEIIYAGMRPLSEIDFKGDIGYVVGEGVLLKSEDNGATWFTVFVPTAGYPDFYPRAVFFLDAQRGYVGTSDGTLFYTKDGGKSWEQRLERTTVGLQFLFFASESQGYAITFWNDFKKTMDGGRTWQAVDLSGLGWGQGALDTWFLDNDHGYLVTTQAVYSTGNGGATWTPITGFNESFSRIKFVSPSEGYIYGSYGVAYATTNGGNTWQKLIPNIWPSIITDVTRVGGKILVIGYEPYSSYSGRSMAVSPDNGGSWEPISQLSNRDLFDVAFSTNKKGIIFNEAEKLKTEDNGLTWKPFETGLKEIGDFLFYDESTLFAVSEKHIFKSTDAGTTFRKVLHAELEPAYLPAGKLYKFGSLLFSVSWTAVYRSEDLGETWNLVSTDPGYFTQGMHFISSLVGYRIELFGSVEKTTDGGQNWTRVFTSHPGEADAFGAIYFIDENMGFSGGDYLRKTTDGGVTWNKINWPLFDIIGIRFENEMHGYVISRRGGIEETFDGGVTFRTINYESSEINNYEFNGNNIFIVGKNGLAARINTQAAPPSVPGYIFGPTQLCAGEVATYQVSVNGTYSTQWTTNALNIDDQPSSVVVHFPDPGIYTLSARHFNECGESVARTITITVSDPEGTVIDGPKEVLSGQKNVVYSTVNDAPGGAYVWRTKGTTEATPSDNLISVNWGAAGQGEVAVTLVSEKGCRASSLMEVTIQAVEEPTGIEHDLVNQVSIYPNPTSGDAIIISNYHKPLQVRILDVTGRAYSSMALSPSEKQTLATAGLPGGLYVMELSDGQRTQTKKLIRK